MLWGLGDGGRLQRVDLWLIERPLGIRSQSGLRERGEKSSQTLLLFHQGRLFKAHGLQYC